MTTEQPKDIDVSEARLREATRRFEQVRSSGDAEQADQAKKEVEAAFNEFARQRK